MSEALSSQNDNVVWRQRYRGSEDRRQFLHAHMELVALPVVVVGPRIVHSAETLPLSSREETGGEPFQKIRDPLRLLFFDESGLVHLLDQLIDQLV